ncbi:MAG: MoaD/ThiS family protein [Elusimicrobiota bacterium]|jgi:adenylyltransferase/sulfurtransferase|nr:MoaD/ThiS family protein [Elusimicrobiota bacterium]
MAVILIPTALRGFTDRQSKVEAEGKIVREIIKNFADKFPDIKTHLYDEKGELRSFINIFIGEKNIKNLKGLDSEVLQDDTLSIVPAIAGGAE